MEQQVTDFFRTDYMPHGHCYLWKPDILWLNVISDAAIAAAYFTIPFVLYLFVRQRQDIRFGWMLYLFAAFILCCGITHLFGIYTVWQGAYGYHGIAKAVTAIVSLSTAYVLIKILPDLISIPSLSEYAKHKDLVYRAELDRLELIREQERLATVRLAVEGSPFGMLVTDALGHIRMVNTALTRMFDYDEQDLLNEHVNTLLPPEQRSHHRKLVEEISVGIRSSGLMTSRVVYGLGKTGKKIPVEVTLYRSELDGEVRVFATVVDISERLSYQAKLVEANDRFERVISGSRDAPWEWYPADNSNWFSPRFLELLGWPANAPAHIDTWKEHIHPDYLDKVMTHLREHVELGNKYDINYLGRAADGTYHWFNTRGDSQRDEQGNLIVMSGMVSDVQDEKELEAALMHKTAFLESVFTGASSGLLVLDWREDDEVWVSAINHRFAAMLGLDASQLEQQPLSLLEKLDRSGVLCRLRDYLSGNVREDGESGTFGLVHAVEGRWFQIDVHPISDVLGDWFRVVVSSSDVTELKYAEQRLESALKEKVSLLNEVHHRVKNNLQIVSSLMDIQSRQVKKEEQAALSDLKNRIRAMALIHELLYQNDSLASINLQSYVNRLVNLIGDTLSKSSREQLNLNLIDEGKPLNININQMVPLGLLICEAVTNAFKYAFHDRQGTLTVRMERRNGLLQLEVCDDGPGFDNALFENASLSSQLGFTLMKTFAKQAGFSIQVDGQKGTCVKLSELAIE
ncbi:PAS domain S-box protein [Bowmanella sp. Y26]|uniref:PAS domain S-box protein n=1 Tax=Bowmanella yangjiangensis TaxID=2811230 RepID=UPI001BDD7D50|nr:PAS domain S-box protein [Bowmanella yangjiangensis]MBT1065694.1 PAS domain S-box protein [Bowmanella yangjiangensis]